jgi:hypothetical protein
MASCFVFDLLESGEVLRNAVNVLVVWKTRSGRSQADPAKLLAIM